MELYLQRQQFYNFLVPISTARTQFYILSSSVANWGKDFPDPDLVVKILQGLNKVQQLTPNVIWRETQLKIIHRAHIPFLSSKTDQSKASCPLCHQPRPSLTHHFWPCLYLSTFWEQVLSYILKVTLLKLPKDPLLLIFGHWDPPTAAMVPNYKFKYHWKLQQPPPTKTGP